MAQRSGMPGYSVDQMAILGWSRDDVAKAVQYVEPVYSARSEFSYVNTLWLWAAKLAETKTGLSWENLMARRILGPLGMTESTVDPEVLPYLGDVATGHITLPDGSPWPVPASYPYASWVDTYGPAGNLRSNAVDMTKWARLHLAMGTFEGQQILAPATVARLHAGRTSANVVPDGLRSLSYAQGWLQDVRAAGTAVWHNGGTTGMHSIVALYPSVNMALVVLTNTNGNTIPELLDGKLWSLVFAAPAAPASAVALPAVAAARFVPERLSRAALAVPALPNARYVGTYANPAYGTVFVFEKGGALALRIGPRPVEMPMAHYAGNVFKLTMPGDPVWESPATFVVPPGANATRLQIEAFEEVKGGWFERTDR